MERHGRFGALPGRRFWLIFGDVEALFRRLAEQACRPFFFFGLDRVAAGAEGFFLLAAVGAGLATIRANRLRVLNLAAFQLGQFFIQVQVVQVQLFGGPLFLADRPRGLCGWLDRFRCRRLLEQRATPRATLN